MKILIVDDVEGWRNYHKEVLHDIFEEAEFTMACSAKTAYDKIFENNNTPFDVIITDLQMESDYEPKYAGEWFIERVKEFKSYLNTKIIIISGAYNIKHIAESYGVECIQKSTAYNFPESYKSLLI